MCTELGEAKEIRSVRREGGNCTYQVQDDVSERILDRVKDMHREFLPRDECQREGVCFHWLRVARLRECTYLASLTANHRHMTGDLR